MTVSNMLHHSSLKCFGAGLADRIFRIIFILYQNRIVDDHPLKLVTRIEVQKEKLEQGQFKNKFGSTLFNSVQFTIWSLFLEENYN